MVRASGLLAALLLAGLLPSGWRARGGAGFGADVVLEAAAEGPQGLRRLGDGAVIAPDERVVFRVSASRRGSLHIVDDAGRLVFPVQGTWWVGPGTVTAGGSHALSWRPEAAGPVTLHAVLCVDASRTACVEDLLHLELR